MNWWYQIGHVASPARCKRVVKTLEVRLLLPSLMNICKLFGNVSRHTQGILGELTAQLVLTYLGYEVAIPTGIHLPYDLLAELDGQLYKVQVKTTNRIVGGTTEAPRYEVFIATSGGNTRKNSVKAFDPSLIDIIFELSGDGSCW